MATSRAVFSLIIITNLEEATDIKAELERIHVEYLNWNSSRDNYFLLSYGCGNKMCDLVLIQVNALQEVKTFYLANGIFIQVQKLMRRKQCFVLLKMKEIPL